MCPGGCRISDPSDSHPGSSPAAHAAHAAHVPGRARRGTLAKIEPCHSFSTNKPEKFTNILRFTIFFPKKGQKFRRIES